MHEASHIAELVGGVVALLLIAAAILAATKRIKLPFTVLLVVVGMGLSWVANGFAPLKEALQGLKLSPDIILYVFLPTLIFEAAFNLDGRQLRRSLGQVLTLAVPGLLVSTLVIGLIVGFLTPIPLAAAFLLGAILSATDPVAVISLFKVLGAPKRLSVLVEGESLFNDATSIVVARILIGVVLAGSVSFGTVAHGVVDFFVVFLGGLAVGWGLGLLVGYVLGKVESDPYIEITLTTILAYLSFIFAEDVLHLSGVMACVGAGLSLGGWGRMRISPSVRTYLEHFWEYMAFVANALIFLLVGLRVELSALWDMLGLLILVIVAMLVSRAIVVYGFTSLVGRLTESESVDRRYQTVMFWGGLRGAIALAIVLSLPAFEQGETFVTLVIGAVLFTLLVQGLTIEPLLRRLGLDRPPLPDRVARVEGNLTSKQRALDRIPELLAGGLFSGPIAERLQEEYQTQLKQIKQAIEDLRRNELDSDQERQLLYLQVFAEEKSLFIDMFNKGHLSEAAFRELILRIVLQVDAVRYTGSVRDIPPHRLFRRHFEKALFLFLDRLPTFRPIAERMRMARIAMDYEQGWGTYQGSASVLKYLDELAQVGAISPDLLATVRDNYRRWNETAQQHLDHFAEQFPEFVTAMQEQLGRRLVLLAENQAIEENAEHGKLPREVAKSMQAEIFEELRALRGKEIHKLKLEPTELLRKVPLFREVPPDGYTDIAARMRAHSVPDNEIIIRQGQAGDSLFLIARGVVRVAHEEQGVTRDIATLMAGDFFGEMALLHSEPRTATVRAVTPCSLYELRQRDLNASMEAYPAIRRLLEEADRKRKAELTQS
jgi:CPA1 family monovalent cation:H+ antiporter